MIDKFSDRFWRFSKNTRGKDYVVGDVHGHRSRLERALQQLGFDYDNDRLFIAGDLIDRGPESYDMVGMLSLPWCFAVRGNHDNYAVNWEKADQSSWTEYGGGWFYELDPASRKFVVDTLSTLPAVIEIECEGRVGKVGVVHADIPYRDWDLMRDGIYHKSIFNHVLNSRSRIEMAYEVPVANVDWIFAGHTPMIHPTILGNFVYIDTQGWQPYGVFTFAELGPQLTLHKCTGDFE